MGCLENFKKIMELLEPYLPEVPVAREVSVGRWELHVVGELLPIYSLPCGRKGGTLYDR